jgi:hypothetical protein
MVQILHNTFIIRATNSAQNEFELMDFLASDFSTRIRIVLGTISDNFKLISFILWSTLFDMSILSICEEFYHEITFPNEKWSVFEVG